jgi:AcrR family transcriptional regulator
MQKTKPKERVLTARGAATRGRIVEAAAALIRDNGVAGTSLDDIGAATATSKSQLFHYFPDGKADLVRAVAVHEAREVIADQQPYLGELTSRARWQDWQRRVIDRYDAQRDRCPLTALTTHMGMATPDTREIITALYDTWQGHLEVGVQALVDAGEIDPDTDVEATATSILAAIQGGVLMMQATDRMSYLEVALEDAVSAMWKAPAKAGSARARKAAVKRTTTRR